MAGARDYKLPDVKKLFAFSSNECANPACKNEMISDDSTTVLGEICHISGANSKGPRWREELDDDYRRDYNNLILLCSPCHKEIDNKENESRFNETLLLEWKEGHLEKAHREQIDVDDNIAIQAIQNLEEWFESINGKLEHIEQGIQDVKAAIQNNPRTSDEQQQVIDVNKILTEFQSATYALRACENWFGNVMTSHLERNETNKIHQWITEPLRPNSAAVCLLIGNAGTGKTVILGDLLAELEQREIPVLGIKADLQFALNRKELERQLGLSHPFQESIETVMMYHDRLVILIDQIDSLSLSQTEDSRFINTYLHLINEFSGPKLKPKQIQSKPQKLKSEPRKPEPYGLRIIVSIRDFDFKYNPSLKFPSQHHTEEVSVLGESEVRSVIDKLEFDLGNLSQKLIHLLRTPLHLDIFCKVHESIADFHAIRGLNDLYHELWRQKVSLSNELSPTARTRTKQLLYTLVEKATTGVHISVNSTYLDDYTVQLDYLCSCGLINRADHTIHFFHQTFHDYIFSRQFVEKEQNLTDYILNNGNALAIRSVVKMIITFLREDNLTGYIQSIESILTHEKIAFHIKLLVENLLGFEEELLNDEYRVAQSVILPSADLSVPFIESVNSQNWLKFLLDQKATDAITNEDLSEIERWPYVSLFQRLVPKAPELVLTYFLHLPDYDLKTDHVQRVLYHLKDWKANEAVNLFISVQEKLISQPFWFLSILEKAAPSQFDLVSSSYFKYVTDQLSRISDQDKPNFDYHEKRLIEILSKQSEGKTFKLLIEIIESVINKTSFSNDAPYIIDRAFWMCNYEQRRESHSHEFWFEMASDLTKTLASKKSPTIGQFINDNGDVKIHHHYQALDARN